MHRVRTLRTLRGSCNARGRRGADGDESVSRTGSPGNESDDACARRRRSASLLTPRRGETAAAGLGILAVADWGEGRLPFDEDLRSTSKK
jgi:hypothetical protein